jgi:hypothetical protein
MVVGMSDLDDCVLLGPLLEHHPTQLIGGSSGRDLM